MGNDYVYGAIAVMAAVTVATRAAPFAAGVWLRSGQLVERLRDNLPPAILVALIAYCLKDVSLTSPPYGAPAAAALAACVGLQILARNALLSIGVGTALYVLLSWAVR
jgi:branched-subunit amino acid transport protein AzlD